MKNLQTLISLRSLASGWHRLCLVGVAMASVMNASAQTEEEVTPENVIAVLGEGVTATISNKGFLISTEEAYSPGLMSRPGSGDLYSYTHSSAIFSFQSENGNDISYSCRYVVLRDDEDNYSYFYFDSNRFGSNPKNTPELVCRQDNTLDFTSNIYSPNTHLYIYDIRVSACDHSGGNSTVIGYTEATCRHRSREIHECSDCHVLFYGKETGDYAAHVSPDDGSHYCRDCSGFIPHIDEDGDGMCDFKNCRCFMPEAIAPDLMGVTLEIENNDWFRLTEDAEYAPGIRSRMLSECDEDTSCAYSYTSLYFSTNTSYDEEGYHYQPFTVSFQYAIVDADEKDCFNFGFSDSSFDPQNPSCIVSSYAEYGNCGLSVYTETKSPNARIYIYNIKASTCDHSGDTSPVIGYTKGHCSESSREIHECSVCHVFYYGEETGEYGDHVLEDEGYEDGHYCSICWELTPHIDVDKDGECDYKGCNHIIPEVVAPKVSEVELYIENDGFKAIVQDNSRYPGIRSMMLSECSEDYYGTNSEATLSFGSGETYDEETDEYYYPPFSLSFQYAIVDAEEDDWFSIDSDVYSGFNPQQTTGTISVYVEKGYCDFRFTAETYSPNACIYIYNIQAVICDHKENTSEPIGREEATCAQGSHDVYICSVCGLTFYGPEANDQLPHVDEDEDHYCDVCGEILLEKVFTLNGVKASFVNHRCGACGDKEWHTSSNGLSASSCSEGSAQATITLTSDKPFSLSFNYGIGWSDEDHYYVYFSVKVDDEYFSIRRDGSSSSYSKTLEAGTHTIHLDYEQQRAWTYAYIRNLVAEVITSGIDVNNDGVLDDEDTVTLQDVLLGSQPLEDGDLERMDLNEDGEVNVGDIIILQGALNQQKGEE